MTTDQTVMANYTDALTNLPPEAFLGSLLYFSISAADVELDTARAALTAAQLDTSGLRKNLRPVDAFRKATKRFEKKFKPQNGVRSELLVRPVGEDGAQAYRHLILERAVVKAGQRRRIFFEKVGEITFTRGAKVNGEYDGHGVEIRRTTDHLGNALTVDEDQWLTEQIATFEDHYQHLLKYMDSHAVRTFVREYIYALSGVCVKESGGLYFIKQKHVDEVQRLASWVKAIGSEFHSLPLMNFVEQRDMIMEAFEDEAVAEVERLMVEVGKILGNSSRNITQKTYDMYVDRATALASKLSEYNSMLDTKAGRAQASISLFGQQVLTLHSKIKEPKHLNVRVVV